MEGTSSSRTAVPEWVGKRLESIEKLKSDRAVVKSEFRRVDGKLDDLEGRLDKGHSCVRERKIAEMQGQIATNVGDIEDNTEKVEQVERDRVEETKRMYSWYIRGLAALILFLVTSGVGFVWYLAGMAFNLEVQGDRLMKIETQAQKTSVPSASLEKLIEDASDRAARKTVKHLEEASNPP